MIKCLSDGVQKIPLSVYGFSRSKSTALTFSPDWRVVGGLLILICLLVDFEIRVINSEDSDEVGGNKV